MEGRAGRLGNAWCMSMPACDSQGSQDVCDSQLLRIDTPSLTQRLCRRAKTCIRWARHGAREGGAHAGRTAQLLLLRAGNQPNPVQLPAQRRRRQRHDTTNRTKDLSKSASCVTGQPKAGGRCSVAGRGRRCTSNLCSQQHAAAAADAHGRRAAGIESTWIEHGGGAATFRLASIRQPSTRDRSIPCAMAPGRAKLPSRREPDAWRGGSTPASKTFDWRCAVGGPVFPVAMLDGISTTSGNGGTVCEDEGKLSIHTRAADAQAPTPQRPFPSTGPAFQSLGFCSGLRPCQSPMLPLGQGMPLSAVTAGPLKKPFPQAAARLIHQGGRREQA